MLTKLRIRNFKQFDDIEIELGQSVVFIGPNNSGKTTALQALALWSVGHFLWKRSLGFLNNGIFFFSEEAAQQTVPNSLLAAFGISVTNTDLIWRKREIEDLDKDTIEITLSGTTNAYTWNYYYKFKFATNSAIYCLPNLGETYGEDFELPHQVPEIAFLLPMSSPLVVHPRSSSKNR